MNLFSVFLLNVYPIVIGSKESGSDVVWIQNDIDIENQ
jgi:hypothetical protein